MIERSLTVLQICIPIFALMALGKYLSLKGKFEEHHREFVNQIVYWYCLPSLIFVNVAKQPMTEILNPALFIGCMGAILSIGILYWITAWLVGFKQEKAAVYTYGTFWANVTYMGFPLAQNAFGPKGLAYAAIVNAFAMPAFVIIGFMLISFHQTGSKKSFKEKMVQSLVNPVVISSLCGILVAYIGNHWNGWQNPISISVLNIGEQTLKLIGSMGLPIALLSIGSTINPKVIRGNYGALMAVVSAKLILLPALTWFIISHFYPECNKIGMGTAVLLMATPNAMSCYVISKQMNVAVEFVSALLVASTLAAIVTIPFWTYFVL